MSETRIKVDAAEVKRILEEAKDWTAECSVCHEKLIGTLAEIRKHKHG